MSEQKMREALEATGLIWCAGDECFVGFTEGNNCTDAIRQAAEALAPPAAEVELTDAEIAREALAQQPVDYPDLRDALEDMVAAFGGGGIEVPLSERVAALDKACKALAGQSAAGVELTDDEIRAVSLSIVKARSKGMIFTYWQNEESIAVIRAVIAAHEAKKNGGGV